MPRRPPAHRRKRDPFRRAVLAPRIVPKLYECPDCHDGEFLTVGQWSVCACCGRMAECCQPGECSAHGER